MNTPHRNPDWSLFLGAFMLFILQVATASAANIYADQTLGADCTSGNYSTSARTCTGLAGNAYNTIQEAINAASVGDIIYMRVGTYGEIGIDIPESMNGTAWTTGDYTTLTSYTGEWAIIDGTDLGLAETWTKQAIIMHPNGYAPRGLEIR